jgi:hypothetical protein
MKIRNGFVSNSSSSSFMIYGTTLDSEDDAKAALKKVLGDKPLTDWRDQVWLKDDGSAFTVDDLDGMYDVGEYLASELGLEFHGNGDYGYWLGASWDSIGDDETANQFKARVKDVLARGFGESVSVATHEESWYDG